MNDFLCSAKKKIVFIFLIANKFYPSAEKRAQIASKISQNPNNKAFTKYNANSFITNFELKFCSLYVPL